MLGEELRADCDGDRDKNAAAIAGKKILHRALRA